ncbi:MAG: hypothetical protein OQK04_15270 [Kangiellaceae bacterium]|nr:hypothetical protein [Kangiellaceae bacterium]MCW9000069.1 hypothetical protein [Kangiellaceae bacterium]
MKQPKNKPLKLTETFQLRQRESGKALDKKDLEAIQSRFLSHVSHELRTPLSVIKMYVEAIRDGMYDNEDEAFAKLQAKFQEFEALMDDLIEQEK